MTWPQAGYSHQCWHNDDFTWVISNDETALNNTWQMVNITDLNNATLGTNQSMSALARALGPIVGGLAFTGFSPGAPFFLSAGVVALAVPLAVLAVRGVPTAAPPSA